MAEASDDGSVVTMLRKTTPLSLYSFIMAEFGYGSLYVFVWSILVWHSGAARNAKCLECRIMINLDG